MKPLLIKGGFFFTLKILDFRADEIDKLLAFLLPAAKSYRKQLLIAMLILATGFIARNKKNAADAIDIDNLLVCVTQVDKDGTKKYSKAFKVVAE